MVQLKSGFLTGLVLIVVGPNSNFEKFSLNSVLYKLSTPNSTTQSE